MTDNKHKKLPGEGSGGHSSYQEIRPALSRPVPKIGLLEWFRPGDYDHVHQVIQDLRRLNVTEFRTGVSWADYHTPTGEKWYSWLIPTLAREVNLLPCFLYTPPSLGIKPRTSSPPRDPKVYADFLDVMITKFGKHFEWVELWNEPMNLSEWDWTLDNDWVLFGRTIGGAAHWARQRGKKTVLGGMSPIDPNWLELMFNRGVMDYIDVVGIHGFPGTWEYAWDGWPDAVEQTRKVLDSHHSKAAIWITETGYSTRRNDEHSQLVAFVKAIEAPVDRVYWYSIKDLNPDLPTIVGFHLDERQYHFGMKLTNNNPKLLYRLWGSGGIKSVQETSKLNGSRHSRFADKQATLITGGAGFIGTNLADRLLRLGHSVLIFDNLSRPGVEENWRWLSKTHGDRVQIEVADVRDRYALRHAVRSARQVYHFAAQVAVTSSLSDVTFDFENNVLGTLNLLEELRTLDNPPPLIFTSTNKVYGGLEDVKLKTNATRYEPTDALIRLKGIGEKRPLDFHSPYGCSKGSADQYVLDHARTFNLPTVVFRMSCIYGPHQHGTEDQGWVAHFLIRALKNLPITLYGDGMQVRDILFVDDLVDAFLIAETKIDHISGRAFNIGGGPENTVSLIELIDLIGRLNGEKPVVHHDHWRLGDQRYYVTDISQFRAATGWSPKTSIRRGVEKLHQWLTRNQEVSIPQIPVDEKNLKVVL